MHRRVHRRSSHYEIPYEFHQRYTAHYCEQALLSLLAFFAINREFAN